MLKASQTTHWEHVLQPRSWRRTLTLALVLAACSGSNDNSRDGRVDGNPSIGSTAEVRQPDAMPGRAHDTAQSEAATRPDTMDLDTVGSLWTTGPVDQTHRVNEAAILAGVRFARHDTFDRIVFEFAHPEIPSYHIEYIDAPVLACGSGDVVPLPGTAWLAVRLEPARAHNEEGRPTIPSRVFTPRLPTLLELRAICDFEAVVEWVGAVRTPARFRVLELRSPARLVVDLRHP